MSRRAALVIIVILAPLALLQSSSAALAPDCPATTHLEGVGLVCPRANGLFEVLGPQGESLGFVHGTDSIANPLAPALVAQSVAQPTCVAGAAGDSYIHAIYARASNDADNYAATIPVVRTLVTNATRLVNDAAVATGGHSALRVLCAGGLVTVENAVLPTPMASANFSSIVADLRALGYTDAREKYWVWYDDTGACGCSGTGHIYNDSRLLATNANNGNAQAMFAVDFGHNDVRTWLHELSHNMGAVQTDAPHSTSFFHCSDGLDTMCYQDGGARQCTTGFSCPGVCSVEVYDCGKDDYFHANPSAGNYLATHWNVGNRLNRYIDFGNPPPTGASLACAPAPSYATQLVTCSFNATDDGALNYTLDWGDGSAPATASGPSGATRTATHAWAAPGSPTLTLVATDAGGLNATRTLVQTVWSNAAPTVTSLACGAAVTFASVTCSVNASDDHGALFYTILWGDGASTRVPAVGTLAPGVAAQANHSWTTPGNFTMRANATDNGVPVMRSADALLVVPVARAPCVYAGHHDTLPLGLEGTQQEGVSSRTWADVPNACGGWPYSLVGTAAAVHDVDACWFSGATQIRCDNAGADESGIVPMGATKLVVVARLGAEVSYDVALG